MSLLTCPHMHLSSSMHLSQIIMFIFCFPRAAPHRDLHSFPTRRSSDLSVTLSATAKGTPAPTYQWRRDGTAIPGATGATFTDRKSTRLNSSHLVISYAVFCLKKKNQLNYSRTGGVGPTHGNTKQQRDA